MLICYTLRIQTRAIWLLKDGQACSPVRDRVLMHVTVCCHMSVRCYLDSNEPRAHRLMHRFVRLPCVQRESCLGARSVASHK